MGLLAPAWTALPALPRKCDSLIRAALGHVWQALGVEGSIFLRLRPQGSISVLDMGLDTRRVGSNYAAIFVTTEGAVLPGFPPQMPRATTMSHTGTRGSRNVTTHHASITLTWNQKCGLVRYVRRVKLVS